MLSGQVQTSTVKAKPGDALDHIVCCADDNLTMCGLDATEMPWDYDVATSCVVCDDLHNSESAFVCPKGLSCL